jgi:hypothetical protein
MFFNKSIELSKTKEAENRNKFEFSRMKSAQSIIDNQNKIVQEQNSLIDQGKLTNLGFRKSKSRVFFESKMDKLHNIDKLAKSTIGIMIGEIVHESLWIDDLQKEICKETIIGTTKNLVVAMFESGQLSYKLFNENPAIAVRNLFEAAKEKAQKDADDELKDDKLATKTAKNDDTDIDDDSDDADYASDNFSQDSSQDKDADDMANSARQVTRKSSAAQAIIDATKKHVLDTLAAEREIATDNVARAKEIHTENGRLIRNKRETPTLWRSINVNVNTILGESAETEKIVAESLAVYTFLEAMSVMNLINPSQENINNICKKLMVA